MATVFVSAMLYQVNKCGHIYYSYHFLQFVGYWYPFNCFIFKIYSFWSFIRNVFVN